MQPRASSGAGCSTSGRGAASLLPAAAARRHARFCSTHRAYTRSRAVQQRGLTARCSAAADVPEIPSTRAPRGGAPPSTPPPAPAAAKAAAGVPKSYKQEAAASNQEVYDKLIDVFAARKPAEWRKLIAYSSQWPTLAEGVLARVEERAAALVAAAAAAPGAAQAQAAAKGGPPAADGAAAAAAAAAGDVSEGEGGAPEAALELRRLGRRLASVHEELEGYRQLTARFREAPSSDWEGLVMLHRGSLGQEFFRYLDLRIRAAGEVEGGKATQEGLVTLAAQLAALVEAHDRVMRDQDALDKAAESFGELLSVETLEEADARIDELASAGRLDPALLLLMAKAYAGSKETDITREEVKDVMAHLYFKAKENFAEQQPPEVRILKYLLTVESMQDRMKLLEQAFEPGARLSDTAVDYLSTTPQTLLSTIDNVLRLYDSSRGGSTMAGEAAGLMNPQVIDLMRDLRAVIQKKYT